MKKIFTFLFFFSVGLVASAQLLVEDFMYTDGNLTSNAAWSAHSGAGSAQIQVASNTAILQHGGGAREDANTNFSNQTSGSVYYSITFSVNDGAPVTGTDTEYFVHFNGDTGTFVGRLDITPRSGTGDFSVGISTSTSTANETWATDLSFNTSYTVVVEYDITNSTSNLWVDPVNEMSLSISGGTGTGVSVNEISLRQSASSSNETITISEIIVDVVFPTSAMPINLADFTAKPMDNQIVSLDWATATEENNEYFSIEHSTNGRDFIAIDEVDGAINSTEMLYYNYMHKEASKGMNYYRLRQVDTDGTFSFSPIEVVSLESDIAIEVRPTIAEGTITMTIADAFDKEAMIEVYNVLGSLVATEVLARGEVQTILNVNDLQSGHYFIRLTDGLNTETTRFIKR